MHPNNNNNNMHDDDDNDDDIDAIIHKFCAQQRILLEAEYLHPLEDSHTATTVLSHLMVQEVSIGLYGRTVVQFMRDVMLTTPNVHHQTTTTSSLLPSHSMTTGDDVDIRYTSSSTSTITTASSSSSPPGEVPNQKRRRIMSGVICEVTETSISVALSSSFSSPATNKKSSQSSTEENDDVDYVNDPLLRFTILPKSQRIIYERLLCALQQLPASSGRTIVRAMFQPTPAFDGTPSSISPPPPPIDDSASVPPPPQQPSSLPTTEPNAKGPSPSPPSSIHNNNIIHETTHSYRNQHLDDSQTDAIRFALQNESPITLIHGPVTFM